MITIGSRSREEASKDFAFLAKRYTGRRKALKAFTHLSPDFVFWIYPDGTLFDAKDAHRTHYPKGHAYILNDAPDYGGFLRGRLASNVGSPLLAVYCRPEALAENGQRLAQLLKGLSQLPVPLSEDTLVVSDNADMFGTVADLRLRLNAKE